jgi:hypothetical protein
MNALMYRTAVGTCLLLACGVGACRSSSSSDLATNEIRADMLVRIEDRYDRGGDAGSAGAGYEDYLAAHLYKGNSDFNTVHLTEGDVLSASTNLTANIPLRDNDIGPGLYDSKAMDLSAITEASFALTRANMTSAPSSHVSVPEAIQLVAPQQGGTVSLAGGKVTFRWSNPVQGATAFVRVGLCDSVTVSASTSNPAPPTDTGSYDLSVADMGGMPSTPTCYFAEIVRTTHGAVDPAWASGSAIEARRSYSFRFTGTP